MSAGCLLMTDIRTTNSTVISSNIGAIQPAAGLLANAGGGLQQPLQSIHCVLHNKQGSVGVAGQFAAQNVDAASEVVVGLGAGGNGAQGGNQSIHRVMMWTYDDTRPIEDAGVLCPNPFGKTMKIRLHSLGDYQTVKLTSLANLGVLASNGTSLNIEMEVLMLPNPTPADK